MIGVAGQTGPDLHPALRWVVALGVPWLVAAFAAGALLGDPCRGERERRAVRARRHLVLAAELAAGVALALGMTRRMVLVVPAVVLTALVAVAVGVTEDGVRDAMRVVGWNGA